MDIELAGSDFRKCQRQLFAVQACLQRIAGVARECLACLQALAKRAQLCVLLFQFLAEGAQTLFRVGAVARGGFRRGFSPVEGKRSAAAANAAGTVGRFLFCRQRRARLCRIGSAGPFRTGGAGMDSMLRAF
ncbi:MAG: hypothetical protein WDZ63_07085 [Burkholderiales bacterium]